MAGWQHREKGCVFANFGGTNRVCGHPGFDPTDLGLRGLSGIAHGLLAITAVEMIATATSKIDRVCGLLCLTAVLAKSCLEALTGHAVLATLHFGMLGTPIAICHAGGVLGGLIFLTITYPPTSARASAARAVER